MQEYLRQRAKARMLRVTMPDGEVLCFNKPKQTFEKNRFRTFSFNYTQNRCMPPIKQGITPKLQEIHRRSLRRVECDNNGEHV